MKSISIKELQSNTEKIVLDAIHNDEFVAIKHESGNAVLINENEWNELRKFMTLALNSTK